MISRQFRIKVNGRTFEVDVEEIGGQASSPTPASSVTRKPGAVPPPVQGPRGAPAAIPVQAPAPAARSVDGPGWVQCPMAGKIQKIPVKIGDTVSPNTVVAVLEAMKMETSVCAGMAGTVKDIAATEGTVVDSGAPLVRIA